MANEVVGIIVFSVFMLCLVSFLVGNLFVALYRERKQRRSQIEPQPRPPRD